MSYRNLLVVTLSVFFLVGCGGGSSGSATPTAVTPPSPTTPPVTASPSFEVTVNADKAEVSSPTEITYRFEFSNTGNVELRDLTIESDDFDTTNLSGCPIQSLAENVQASCSFVRNVNQTEIDAGALLEINVSANAKDVDGNSVAEDNTSNNSVSVAVINSPKIEIVSVVQVSDSDDSGVTNTGDVLNYTFTIANTGNVTLKNIRVYDDIGNVSGELSELAPNTSENTSFTNSYTLLLSDVLNGSFSNLARVTANNPQNNSIDATADNLVVDIPLPPTVKRAGNFPWSEKEIELTSPNCFATDAVIIETVEDLDLLNSDDYRIFCIKPGDYREYTSPLGSGAYHKGQILLTSSGSQTQKRVLALYNPDKPDDRTAAVQLPESERAILSGFRFDNATHWIIDRLTFEMEQLRLNRVVNGSTDNIFNANLFNESNGRAIYIGNLSHRNTIQNNVWRNTPTGVGDRVAVLIGDSTQHTDIFDTHIINNECYNTTDCVQLFLSDPASGEDVTSKTANFAGTLIENNDFYNTEDTILDCPEYHKGPVCSWYENGVDVKSGSFDADRPVVIRNNRVWNYFPAHPESGSSSSGGGIIAHQKSTYVTIEDNIIHTGRRGIVMYTNRTDVQGFNSSGNRIQDMSETAVITGFGENLTVNNNILDNVNIWMYGGTNPKSAECNVVLRSTNVINGSTVNFDKNAFYDTPIRGTNYVTGSLSDAKMTDYCYDRKMWTGVEQHCLANMQTTDESPHANLCN